MDDEMNVVLEQNIEKLRSHRDARRQKRRIPQRMADAVTRFAGSLYFVYLHMVIVGVWILINVGWTPWPRFDPTFVILATVASVEAIFISTFILISQNEMNRHADERADLHLQIGLLAEHEITRLIQLTSAIAARLKIAEAEDPHLEELKRDVSPEKVVNKIQEENSADRPRNGGS